MALQTNRAKQKSKQMTLIIVIVGILILAGAAFFFINKNDAIKKLKPPAQERQPGKIAMPMIRSTVPVGGVITMKNIRVTYYKPYDIPMDAVISPKAFLNRRATRILSPGDYIHDGDVAPLGAPKGYSGLVEPGKRIVVVPARAFPGTLGIIKVGDHVDLLSIDSLYNRRPTGGASGSKDLRDSLVTLEGGGSQPGDSNSAANRRAIARKAGAGGAKGVNPTTATLIAEDAKVIGSPKRGRYSEFVVFQMSPQDAHVTTLALAAGNVLRMVYRPYNDPKRLTLEKGADVTTRAIRAEPDPDIITVISGGNNSKVRPLIMDVPSRTMNNSTGLINLEEYENLNDEPNEEETVIN